MVNRPLAYTLAGRNATIGTMAEKQYFRLVLPDTSVSGA